MSEKAPTGSEQSPDTPKGGNTDQDVIDRAVKTRLDRERKKHAEELAAGRDEAVAAFKKQHGLTDEVLAELGEGKLSTFYKRISELETELQGFRQKEAAMREEKRQAMIKEAVRAAAPGGFVHEELETFAVGKLLETLTLGEDGKLQVEGAPDQNAEQAAKAFLGSRPYLLAPVGQGGSGSQAPGGSVARGEPQKQEHPLLGKDFSPEERRRALADGLTR